MSDCTTRIRNQDYALSMVLINRWAIRHSGLSGEHPNPFNLPEMNRD